MVQVEVSKDRDRAGWGSEAVGGVAGCCQQLGSTRLEGGTLPHGSVVGD